MSLSASEPFCVKIINYVANLTSRRLRRLYAYICESCKRTMFYKSYKFNTKRKLTRRRSLRVQFSAQRADKIKVATNATHAQYVHSPSYSCCESSAVAEDIKKQKLSSVLFSV